MIDWPYTGDLGLEERPSHEQRGRLIDFLSELMLISRRYGMVIDSYVDVETPVVRDTRTGTVVGLHLAYFVAPDNHEQVTAYDCEGGSILDGVWLVQTPDGLKEQRHVDGSWELLRRRTVKGVPKT